MDNIPDDDVDDYGYPEFINDDDDDVPRLLLPPYTTAIERRRCRVFDPEKPFLPRLSAAEERSNKKTLVLDLDNTLIYASGQPQQPCSRDVETTGLHMPGFQQCLHVAIRPGVRQLLQRLGGSFEMVIFTAGIAAYARAVARVLDPLQQFFPETHILHQGCLRLLRLRGRDDETFTKDLSMLGRNLSKVILIDDRPSCSQLQPRNAIVLPGWYNDNGNDRCLHQITHFLIRIAHQPVDVRDILPQAFPRPPHE